MTHLGERITDFVFGELPPAGMEEARRHISECTDCKQKVEQFEHTRGILQTSSNVEPPRRLVFEIEKPAIVRRWLVPIGVAAAILIAILIASPLHVQRQDSQLTITFGQMPVPPVPVSPAPVSPAVQQPIDYDRIVTTVQESQRLWLESEINRRVAMYTREIQRLQGRIEYQDAQLRLVERQNFQNEVNIQRLAPRPGVED